MANHQSHITFSSLTALIYAVIGVFILDVYPEYALLAALIILIAGMLPNIDAGNDAPARELGGLLAAVSPLLLIEFFPALRVGGMARIALIVVSGYLLVRIVIVRALQRYTVHRGMLHSIPAAIITFELTYLLFWDLHQLDRLYIASGAMLGFLSHLFLDAYGNLDIVGKAIGKAEKKTSVLKFFGASRGVNVFMYAGVFLLGWFVAKDLYPSLSLQAGIVY